MSAHRMTSDGSYTPGRGLPLAPPVGSGAGDLSAQVSGEFGGSREPNTSVGSTPEVPSRTPVARIGRRALARLEEGLSDRDRAVLLRLAEHRFLTTHQVQGFCFTQHESEASAARSTRRVLARLERDGLVRALDRRVGGVRAGSAATIWQLAAAGSRLVHGDETRRRPGTPSERFLRHRLAVADVHLLLLAHQEIEAIEGVSIQVEPAAWRRYQGSGGEPRWLQPDLYAEITTSEFLDRHFIEVDLGSESLPRLLGKCAHYEAYRSSGIEQERWGSFPLVVWLLTDQRRLARLRQAIERSPRLTAAMYRFALPETLTQVLAGGDV